MNNYQEFMNIAMSEAQIEKSEVPVGAIIVKDNKIIAKAHNLKEKNNDVTAHAEILVIKKAQEFLGSWRLDGCSLYVTLEPCPMCAGAILYSRVENVIFGASDSLYGAFGSKMDMRAIMNLKTNVTSGICEKECENIIKEFFKNKRIRV